MFRDHTYIFVFDSLNGKHPGATKNLSQYLRFEAMDKKGIENSSSPEGMAALVSTDPDQHNGACAHQTSQVPTQDNYCDCGLYLLHFAKVFMEDPAKSFHTILVSPPPNIVFSHTKVNYPSLDEAEDPEGRPRC